MRLLSLVTLSVLAVAVFGTTIYQESRPLPGWSVQPHKQVNKNEVIQMNIGLRRRNMEAAEALFWRVSDPRSTEYGDHLNNKAVAELISPGPEAIRTVMTWLEAHGIKNAKLALHEDYISFKATVGVVEKLLHTEFHVYHHKADDVSLSRALGQIDLPDELAQYVEVIGGHRGFPLPQQRKKLPATTAMPTTAMPTLPPATTVMPTPTPAPATYMNVTPAVMYKAYNFTYFPETPEGTYNLQSFFQAQGQFVDPQDMLTFCGSLLPPQFKNCSITKYIGPNTPTQAGLESSLDSEYIFSMSWGTETWGWSFVSFDFCGDLMTWAQDVFAQDPVKHPYVISMSYGSQQLPNFCMGPDVDRLSKDIMKMGLMGISVMIASGDQGSGEYARAGYNEGLLGNSMPAEIPYCTSVGATTFVLNQNSGQEMATNAFGSGGGFSFYYEAPVYQREAIANFFATSKNLPPPAELQRLWPWHPGCVGPWLELHRCERWHFSGRGWNVRVDPDLLRHCVVVE